MKKSTKGAVAAGAAAVLLMGGAGSLAYWTASGTITVVPELRSFRYDPKPCRLSAMQMLVLQLVCCGLADKEITALTAYLQRLGTDIKWKKVAPQAPAPPAPAAAPAVVAAK